MIVINTVSSTRFSIDGIEYFKNFTPVVRGNTIAIINAYDSKLDLSGAKQYDQYNVNSVVYATVELAQSALLSVLFSRTEGLLNTNSYVFDLSFGVGALAADTNWYSTSREVGTITQWIFSTGNYDGSTNVISESRIVKIALPFNCKMKDLAWYHSTLQTAFTVRVIHGNLGTLNTIDNETIIAEQQFPSNSNQKKGLFTTIKNTSLSMNKDSFIFVALFNNNVSTGALRNNHLQIEFEKV